MRNLIFIFLFTVTPSFSQTKDYNIKKGYVANGYDVVAYFENKITEGNKEFIAKFEGVKYKFSSQKNLNTFNENPSKYAPQYGGYCAYAIAIKSDKVSINPKAFEIRDGKLYLFYNAWGTNTLKLWQKEKPEALIKKADKNWEIIKFLK